MSRPIGHEEALKRAARFCSLKERSIFETQQKLKSWNCSTNVQNTVLEYLIMNNFLNDERFARAFCNDKFKFNSWGKEKIRAHIFKHKVSSDKLEKALSSIDPIEYSLRLRKIAISKWNQVSGTDLEKKAKTIRYLLSKGFEYDLILKMVSSIGDEKSY